MKPFDPTGLYPDDHEFGMRVPEGGSACSKCKYLADNETDCSEEHFISWQQMNDVANPEVIPGRINSYCCDNFSAAKTLTKESTKKMSMRDILDSALPVEGGTDKAEGEAGKYE